VKQVRTTLVVAAAGLALAGCGGGSGSSSPPSSAPASPTSGTSAASTVQVSTKDVAGLGVVLVNGQGRTLYMFAPDKHSKVTCTGGCAAVWPPLKLSSGQTPAAAGQAQQSLLGSDADPGGGRVVTYAGWPLYTYTADTASGAASGQALNLNGGLWYVLTPSGKVIYKAPGGGSY
jgi:predicted lipoprotein with Yx(FWY)xxD motif